VSGKFALRLTAKQQIVVYNNAIFRHWGKQN